MTERRHILYEDFVREARAGRQGAKPQPGVAGPPQDIECIRVTTDSLKGSITTVSALQAHDDEGERLVREIRVHPDDWDEFVAQMRENGLVGDDEPERVQGIAVVHSGD